VATLTVFSPGDGGRLYVESSSGRVGVKPPALPVRSTASPSSRSWVPTVVAPVSVDNATPSGWSLSATSPTFAWNPFVEESAGGGRTPHGFISRFKTPVGLTTALLLGADWWTLNRDLDDDLITTAATAYRGGRSTVITHTVLYELAWSLFPAGGWFPPLWAVN